jgi:long-chain acyl-CoA synthetase
MDFLSNLSKFQLISETGNIYKVHDIIKIKKNFENILGKKKLIFFIGDNDEFSILFYIVCLSLGHCLMPISSNITKKSLNHLIKSFKPEIIFTKEFKKLREFKDHYSFGLYKILKKKNVENKINQKLALLLSTSGSTGNAKFVKLTFENIFANALSIKKYLKLNSSDSTITTLPIHYSYGISVINSHLLADAKIYTNKLSLFDKEFWEILEKKKITNFSGVPFHFEILQKLNIDKLKLKSLKFCTQAGGKLNTSIIKSIVNKFLKLNKKFFVMYGQTEASPRMTYADEKDLIKYPETVGRPIPGGKIFIKDLKKKIGEICYIGKNVFHGYATKRGDLSNLKKISILRTGDIGYVKKGLLFVTGRISRFEKIYGVRINLDNLEKYLNNLNIPCKCIYNKNKIFIFVTKSKINENKIKILIKKDFEISINTIVFRTIKKIPYNNNKKIDYKKLNEEI